MTPAEEDVLYREFKATRYYNTGEFTAFRLAIRAAVAQEQANRRCTITGNPCLTDTWASDRLPDCHCGKMAAQFHANTRAAVAQERERCASIADRWSGVGDVVARAIAAAIRRGE